jgi:hypothetical protein
MLKCFQKSITVLQERLGLLTDFNWKTWLQSSAFKPMWTKLWIDYLAKKGHKTGQRGSGFTKVMKVIIKKKSMFLGPPNNKESWTENNHLVRFLVNIIFQNINTKDRLFFRKNKKESTVACLMWAVLKFIQHKYIPLQIYKPSGSLTLLNEEPVEKIAKTLPAILKNIPIKKCLRSSIKKALKRDLGKGLKKHSAESRDSLPNISDVSQNDSAPDNISHNNSFHDAYSTIKEMVRANWELKL